MDGYGSRVDGWNVINGKGNLTVKKQVYSGDRQRDFSFTVTLDDKSINGICGDMTFQDGVAAFTLKDGESKTAKGLPSGVGYTDVGYGESIDLPLQPTLHFRSPDEDNTLFAKCYVDKGTSTDTCLNVVLYFAAGTSFRQGDLLYVTMQDELGQPYSIAVQPRTYVPVATLTSGSETLTLSPLGMSIRNAHPDREPLVDELSIRYQDGSEFTVESSSRSLMNWVVGCMRGSDDVPFADNTYVFDRLVDVDAVASVTLEGHQHTDSAADDTFTLTYQP